MNRNWTEIGIKGFLNQNQIKSIWSCESESNSVFKTNYNEAKLESIHNWNREFMNPNQIKSLWIGIKLNQIYMWIKLNINQSIESKTISQYWDEIYLINLNHLNCTWKFMNQKPIWARKSESNRFSHTEWRTAETVWVWVTSQLFLKASSFLLPLAFLQAS